MVQPVYEEFLESLKELVGEENAAKLLEEGENEELLSGDVNACAWEQIYAGWCDKSIMLCVIFTISWTNWKWKDGAHHGEEERDHRHKDGTVHLREERMNRSPIRIFLASTTGVLLVTLYQTFV